MDNESLLSQNLGDLLYRKSSNSVIFNTGWPDSSFTKGDYIVVLALMIFTYLLQISGYILSITDLEPHRLIYYNSGALTQPYFEIFQMTIIVVLVHFQFHAFYAEPFLIHDLISKHLLYSNITATILSSTILFSNNTSDNDFEEIYKMNAQIAYFVLACFVYFQVNKYNRKHKLKFSRILGFNVLYSFSIPFILMGSVQSFIMVILFNRESILSRNERVLIVTFFYFVVGFIFVKISLDIYMGFGFFINLLGVFIVQNQNVCSDYPKYCNFLDQIIPVLLGTILICFSVFIIVRYPNSYRFSYKIKRF